MLTQCPECYTVFRVTEAQLGIAQGKVRCGRCKQVFNARDHLQQAALELERQNPPAQPPPAPAPERLQKTVATGRATLSQFDLSGLDTLEVQRNIDTIQAESAAFAAVNAIQAELAFLDTTEDGPAADTPTVRAAVPAAGYDTAIPEALTGFTPWPVSSRIERHILSPWPQAAMPEVLRQPLQRRVHRIHKLGPWPLAATAERLSVFTSLVGPTSEAVERLPFTGNMPNAARAERLFAVHVVQMQAARPSRVIAPELLYPELTDIYLPPPAPFWDRRTLMGVAASLLFVMLLIVQGIYVLRDDFIKYPVMQPFVMQLCQLADCKVVIPRQPDQIRLLSHREYPHPEFSNARIITAVIENRSDSTQPYPIIQLTFRDLQKRLVAVRRFTAEEYLPEDLIAERGITPRQPVNISLQLIDPGVRSYRFDLY